LVKSTRRAEVRAPVDVRRVRGWHQAPDWDECRVENLRYRGRGEG